MKMKVKIIKMIFGLFIILSIGGIGYMQVQASEIPSAPEYHFEYNHASVNSEITVESSSNILDLKSDTLIPSDVTVQWETVNSDIVEISSLDKLSVSLKPQGPGFTTVRAKLIQGGVQIGLVSCYVKVPLEIQDSTIESNGILFSNTGLNQQILLENQITGTQNITWESLDNLVCTVVDGIVHATGAGTANITISTDTKSQITNLPMTKTIKVVVSPVIKDTTDLTSKTYILDTVSYLNINTNAMIATKLKWEVKDLNGNSIPLSDERIDYTISTTDSNFTILDAKAGTYKIRGYADDTHFIDITVIVPIKTSKTNFIMNVNDAISIFDNTNIPYADSFSYSIDTNSNSNEVVSINPVTGTITGVGKGNVSVVLTYTYKENRKLFEPTLEYSQTQITLDINVIDGIALSTTNATITTSGTLMLNAITSDYTKEITWASSDPSVATVNSQGQVTGLKPGKTIISATQTLNGIKKTATATIYVQQSITKITIDPSEVTMNSKDKRILEATVDPQDLYNVSLHWTSSNTDVVKINDTNNLNVTIEGVNPGTAVITAINQDNVVVGYCHVTIKQKVTGIELSEKLVTVPTTMPYYQLIASVTPYDATNKKLIWSSTNTSVATVDDKGLVKIIKSGVATILVISMDDPTITAMCTFNVEVPASTLTLDEKTKLMYVGESAKLGYQLNPENTTHKEVVWSSTDTTIVSVDAKGVVTAKAAGQAIIVLKTADGSMLATCTITVKQKATNIKFDVTDLELNIGQSYTIKTIVTPTNSTELGLVWESSNKAIATVDQNGKVTGVAAGKTIIFAKTIYGGVIYCNITVLKQPTGIQLNYDEKTIVIGEKLQIKATVIPSDAVNNVSLNWSSSKTKVATVSSKGLVTSLSGGTTVIKCQSKDGKFTEYSIIHVVEPITKIKLSKTSYKLGVGKKYTLKTTIETNTASDTRIKWVSSNKRVATVDSNGKVTAKTIGYVTITAQALDGSGAEASCDFRIIRPVTSVRINKSSITIVEGRNYKLKATVSPTNATYRSVNWSTSDNKIAIVDSDGLVTALSEGEVTITAKAKDNGGRYDTVRVIVRPETPASSVTIVNQNVTMIPGESITLQKAINPVGCTDRYTWESDNKSVATVDRATGRIVARSTGIANITIVTESGKTATTTITVVGLSNKYIELEQYSTYQVSVIGVNQGITWSTANNSVAIVNGGLISTRQVGTTTISATVNGRKLSCTVRVVPIR